MEARNAALLRARKALGLGDLDARALLYIATHPDTRPGDLRGYLGITSAGVTTLTNRLIDKGAVAREIDANDRRSTTITVTADLDSEPWIALRHFDHDLAASLADSDPDAAAAFAELLTSAVASLPQR
ncbi:MarR family winged helix-turn-helix transcriptional regulator [Arenivirga flava]|uniref:MarR family winged helix-turn-helix transcriptional regulator n=1 Tax=Arenivirga flava TaxID=1930060 RepID=UPI0024E09479|nr:MarR family transcriptional regulator [Arenivirga flava]